MHEEAAVIQQHPLGFASRPSRCGSGPSLAIAPRFRRDGGTCGVLKPCTPENSGKRAQAGQIEQCYAAAFLLCAASMAQRSSGWRESFSFTGIGPAFQCIPPRAEAQVRESALPCRISGGFPSRKHRSTRFRADKQLFPATQSRGIRRCCRLCADCQQFRWDHQTQHIQLKSRPVRHNEITQLLEVFRNPSTIAISRNWSAPTMK